MQNLSAESGRITIRPVLASDREDLHRWLNNPEVLRYYEGRDKPQSYADIDARYLSVKDGSMARCVILVDHQPAGYLQAYQHPLRAPPGMGLSQGPRVYGVDLFIGEPDLWNQGVGTQAIKLVTQTLVRVYGADAVIVDPRVNNPRAVRAYKKCGYRIARRLKAHEQHEGAFVDCWLMVYQTAKPGVPFHSE